MFREKGVDDLDCDDQNVLDEQIEAKGLRDFKPPVAKIQTDLSADLQPLKVKFMSQTGFVGLFKQPRAQGL